VMPRLLWPSWRWMTLRVSCATASAFGAEAWPPPLPDYSHRCRVDERMSESTQDRPDEADEKDPKPGEPDTETKGGYPKEAPESKEQSKQDQ
jgi:hypothetical protein